MSDERAVTEAGSLQEMVLQGQSVIRIENDMVQQIAVQRPRAHLKVILAKAIEEMEMVPEFAEKNYYCIMYAEKRGDKDESKKKPVEGLSIKAAMNLMRAYGNLIAGGQIFGEDDRAVYLQGSAVDLETNARLSRPNVVRKIVWDRKTQKEIRLDEFKLRQAVQSEVSKMVRNAVLGLLPDALKIPYWRRAKEIAAKGVGPKPIALKDRTQQMVKAFEELGITAEQIQTYLKVENLGAITYDQIGDMVGIFNAITDGELKKDEVFPHEPAMSEGAKVSALLSNGAPPSQAVEQAPKAPPPSPPPDAKAEAVKAIAEIMREIIPNLATAKMTATEKGFSESILKTAFGKDATWSNLKSLEAAQLSSGIDTVKVIVARVKAAKTSHSREGAK